ncbi:MAG TPA: GntG family PLP-dependent aldolase [Candidatus Acidoferrales bacterium]|nr:GntG family PLP-dependent aldolase [Candidatus Acidoferrales bacterium]
MDANIVDLRSDTVTRPTPAMRRAMAEAEVGDDVYGEDPTVNRLEQRAAALFERDAALFVPSGSMGNLIAVKVWTRPGSEVICEEKAHMNQLELASMAAIAGAYPRPIPAPDGILSWERIEAALRPKSYYMSQSALVALENSHSLWGGTLYPTAVAEEICDRAHAVGLRAHLDGARIFNAAAALAGSVAELSRKFDSVMFCLSKGLGAPVGSMLAGSRDFIAHARIVRKLLGGGMRQAGVLAAAALVALEQSPSGLPVDHANARHLAEGLAGMPGIALDPRKVRTNIVVFDVERTGWSPAEICAGLKEHGVLAAGVSRHEIRMVTHYDVNRQGIDRTIVAMNQVLAGAPAGRSRSSSA